MTDESAPVWFVTGCSKGFGREIIKVALERGCRVAATARDPESLRDLIPADPKRAIAIGLDVMDPEQVASAVRTATEAFGAIDVLVNNAGFSYLTSVEDAEEHAVRSLFETNFFGPVALMRAALPIMRARRKGRIVNFSSIGGLAAFAGSGYYAATKFALEGLTEALDQEVRPLGIRAILIEPGPFRTGMAARAVHADNLSEDYASTVGARRAQYRTAGDAFPGDPRRGAEAVFAVAQLADPPLRLVLGRPALDIARRRFQSVLADFDRMEDLTLSADFPEGSPDWRGVDDARSRSS